MAKQGSVQGALLLQVPGNFFVALITGLVVLYDAVSSGFIKYVEKGRPLVFKFDIAE